MGVSKALSNPGQDLIKKPCALPDSSCADVAPKNLTSDGVPG